ncbi:MAG TPA: c-type cytochrome [Methyloradius sp.]
MLEIGTFDRRPLRHFVQLPLTPMRLVALAGLVGFLLPVSYAYATGIKLASADKEPLLIPSTVNIDENSPVFSSHIRTLAASCAACHGTNGNSVGGMPVLAGLDPTRFVVQMQAFRSGERASTVMHHHAKGLTPEEIEQLSRYFAAQKRVQAAVPANQKLDARHDN